MGYYSYYTVSIKNEDEIPMERQKEASLWLADKFGWKEDYERDINNSEYDLFSWVSLDSMKWYDWEKDMVELSKNFPEVIFVIYGEGEDRDDTWRAFVKDGVCVYQRAHIYYDPEPVF